jgi:hypothetical protein
MKRELETVTQAPLPQMVEQLGRAIAEAQYSMDRSSVAIARMMGSTEEGHGVVLAGEEAPRSLLELGFSPTFYQITDAKVEAKVSLTVGRSTETSVGASVGAQYGIFSASVDASYSSKYSYDLTASSSVTAHFVAIPPPAALTRLIARGPSGQDEE